MCKPKYDSVEIDSGFASSGIEFLEFLIEAVHILIDLFDNFIVASLVVTVHIVSLLRDNVISSLNTSLFFPQSC